MCHSMCEIVTKYCQEDNWDQVVSACLFFQKLGPIDTVPDLFCMLQQCYYLCDDRLTEADSVAVFKGSWKCIFLIETFLKPHSLTLSSLLLYI